MLVRFISLFASPFAEHKHLSDLRVTIVLDQMPAPRGRFEGESWSARDHQVVLLVFVDSADAPLDVGERRANGNDLVERAAVTTPYPNLLDATVLHPDRHACVVEPFACGECYTPEWSWQALSWLPHGNARSARARLYRGDEIEIGHSAPGLANTTLSCERYRQCGARRAPHWLALVSFNVLFDGGAPMLALESHSVKLADRGSH